MRSVWVIVALAAAACAVQAADAGKAAYDKSCKACHGADGTANPSLAGSAREIVAYVKSLKK